MTQEEKAKAYDEALKRAKEMYDAYRFSVDLSNFKPTDIEYIFPELRESKDERIRKRIRLCLDECVHSDIIRDYERDECLAYLEKQKEPIPIPDKFSGLKSLMLQYLQSAANRKDDAEIESDTDLWGRKILDYVWKYDEKQKEQKPAPSRETILGIWELGNFWKENPEERGGLTQLQYIQKYWTEKCDYQKEQKDYRKLYGDIVKSEWFKKAYAGKSLGEEDEKEEQEPDWGEEDEKIANEILDHFNTENAEWFNWFNARFKSLRPQPKQEWGEWDSDNLERVDNYLWMLDDYVGDDCATPQGKADKIRGNIQGILSPWLKSLPERFSLQPKQEWSEEDELHFTNAILAAEKEWGKDSATAAFLKSLPERFNIKPINDKGI